MLREFVDAAGLMSCGPSLAAIYRRAARYVDKLLSGARPADLPIEQPSTFDFLVNAGTARALGVSIPTDVASQVTEWIQ